MLLFRYALPLPLTFMICCHQQRAYAHCRIDNMLRHAVDAMLLRAMLLLHASAYVVANTGEDAAFSFC